MAELGVAVFGAGWVSGEHLRAFNNNPHAKVVAIGSRKEASARARAHEAGIECAIYTDFASLLKHPGVDLVSICTPNDLHAEETVLAAEAGKHLVIEKPACVNLGDLRRMTAAVEKAEVKTVVSFVLRWNPLFENIKALLANGALGRIFYAEVDYWHNIGPWWTGFEWARLKSSGGSAFLLGGCHAVDAIRWFVGDNVAEVSAYGNCHNPDYEYDSNVVAAVKFRSGAIGKLSTSFDCQMPYNFNIDLLGTEGSIRGNRLYSKKLLPGQTDFATIPTILPDSGDVSHHPFQGEMDHFVDCILNNEESHCNLADAINTNETCIAIDRSLATGKPVALPLE